LPPAPVGVDPVIASPDEFEERDGYSATSDSRRPMSGVPEMRGPRQIGSHEAGSA